jgi:hypothetical protein
MGWIPDSRGSRRCHAVPSQSFSRIQRRSGEPAAQAPRPIAVALSRLRKLVIGHGGVRLLRSHPPNQNPQSRTPRTCLSRYPRAAERAAVDQPYTSVENRSNTRAQWDCRVVPSPCFRRPKDGRGARCAGSPAYNRRPQSFPQGPCYGRGGRCAASPAYSKPSVADAADLPVPLSEISRKRSAVD